MSYELTSLQLEMLARSFYNDRTHIFGGSDLEALLVDDLYNAPAEPFVVFSSLSFAPLQIQSAIGRDTEAIVLMRDLPQIFLAITSIAFSDYHNRVKEIGKSLQEIEPCQPFIEPDNYDEEVPF